MPTLSKPNLSLIFKALADPARIKILKHLASNEKGICCPSSDAICACDLETLTQLSQPTVSHHMKVLTTSGLTTAKKKGRWKYYQINNETIANIKLFLAEIEV